MNRIKTAFLLTCLTLRLVAMGNAIGGHSGMLIAFVIAGAINFFSYWYSDKIVLKMYRAEEVTSADCPEFYGMVVRLTQRAQLPMPKVYVLPTETSNASATGRNPQNAAVAATERIMRMLTAAERRGVWLTN
nr:hypothetical protein [Malonomonas rubra]